MMVNFQYRFVVSFTFFYFSIEIIFVVLINSHLCDGICSIVY